MPVLTNPSFSSQKISTSDSTSDSAEESKVEEETSIDVSGIPGSQVEGDKMIMAFTCTVCESRNTRLVSKHSYEEGTVVVICKGCENKHLIVDHLGVFGEKGWSFNQALEAVGEDVKVVSKEGELLELLKENVK